MGIVSYKRQVSVINFHQVKFLQSQIDSAIETYLTHKHSALHNQWAKRATYFFSVYAI